jgi:uncharacterized protein YndB with AHSA1/START domain
MRLLAIAALACGLIAAAPAQAEVASASASSFVLEHRATVSASPQEAWRTLTRVSRWWNSSHTYSGDAKNLSLDARAGGCWCERWNGQSVEHARVVMVFEHEGVKTLRVQGALGPLQAMTVNAILTFTLTPAANGTNVTFTYRVSGDASLNLEQIAPLVDGVLGEQFGRFTGLLGAAAP